MKRILYSGFDDKRSHVIDYLSKAHQWSPVVIHGAERNRAWAQQQYSKAFFCEYMQLRNAQFDYTHLGNPIPIDAKLISALSPYESFSMDLVEDTTGWNFSFNERRRYYYDLLRYWNTVIHTFKPEAFVIWTWPHVVTDYVLYQICTFYKIPVLFMNPLPLFNHEGSKFHHVSVSLEEQSAAFKDIYNSSLPLPLSDDLKKYFQALRSKKGMTPPYIAYFFDNPNVHWNPGFKSNWLRETLRLGKLMVTGRFFEPFDVSWKWNKEPFETKKARMSYFQFILFKEQLRWRDGKLKDIYARYIQKPDYAQKFVYYAAAFQPEAGVWTAYQDQLLALDLLSHSLPKDWVIYYKEHPATFYKGDKASLARSQNYYDRIVSYGNVRIIAPTVNTFELIDASQAVATPGGTVGWEAMVRGKPTLTFGATWYQSCKSAFKINSLEDCTKAINSIQQGYKVNPADIERYASAVESISGKNIIHGDFVLEQITASPNPELEMQRIGDLFVQTYHRYYSSKPALDASSNYLSNAASK